MKFRKTGSKYVTIKAGPVAFKGCVRNALYIMACGLGGYAGYRGIKHFFDNLKSKNSKEGSAGDNEVIRGCRTIAPVILTHGDIRAMPNVDFDCWQLIGKLISIEEIAILYCEPGLGKSVMAHQIACDIASGDISLIAPDDQGTHEPQTVLYYDVEMTEYDYQRRYAVCNAPDNLNILLGFYFASEEEWLKDLETRTSSVNGNVFIVLDNLTGAFKSLSAEGMRSFLNVRLKKVQERAKKRGCHITFLIVAHTTKEGILAGVANLQNFGTTILHIKPYDENHIELTVEKSRNYGNEIGGKSYLELKSEEGHKHFEFVRELAKTDDTTSVAAARSATSQRDPKYPALSDEQILGIYDRVRKIKHTGEKKCDIAKEFGIPDSYISRYMQKASKILKDREQLQQDAPSDNTEITKPICSNAVIVENQRNNK